MAQNINVGAQLQPNQSYSFLFSVSGFNPFVTALDVARDIQGIDYLNNVHVAWAGNGVGPIYVEFTYEGDGTDSVDFVASDIANAVGNNHSLFSLAFSSATIGFAPVPTIGGVIAGQAAGVGDALKNIVPGTTTIALVVVGLLVVAFLLSGGPSIVRGATGK